MTNPAPTPAFNTSNRLEALDRADGSALALVAHGGGGRRLSAHYMVIDTAAATPILGEWPHTAAGLKAATRAFRAAVSA
jgi:hypothetical protein